MLNMVKDVVTLRLEEKGDENIPPLCCLHESHMSIPAK
jgi:hypothetical protein